MGFLAPAMWIGALGLALPVAIHLIARSRFSDQAFPAIRLLRGERHANVFAWTLVDKGQLLLRLLVLFLLLLAMARFFAPWLSSAPAPRNLVLVLDGSASMRLRIKEATGAQVSFFDLAKRQADLLLADVAPPSRCAVLLAGDSLELLSPLDTDVAAARAALASARPGDGTGPGLIRAITDACRLVTGRREVKSQIVVLTDLRAGAFESRALEDLKRLTQAQDALGDKLDLVFVDVAGGADENLAILEVALRGGEVRVGDEAHLLARVANFGPEEKRTTLRLDLAGRTEPLARTIVLPAGGEAVVDLTAPVNRIARNFAAVRLQETDALDLDDHRLAPFLVADACRVLLVRGDAPAKEAASSALDRLSPAAPSSSSSLEEAPAIDGATILRYVLNPGRELGHSSGTGIESSFVHVDALATQPLGLFDVIVLYDVGFLPEKALQDIDGFVRSGKALLLIASGQVNPMRFNRTLAAGREGGSALSPAQLGNERVLTPPVGIAVESTLHPWLAPFRDPRQGDLSHLRFSKLRDVDSIAADGTVILRADNGMPLAVEHPVGAGRVMLLTFGVELDRGTLARTRIFPVMMWRLSEYLAGRLTSAPPLALLAASPVVVDVSEAAFTFENEFELSAASVKEPAPKAKEGEAPVENGAEVPEAFPPVRIAIGPDKTGLIPGLPAGSYFIHKPRRDPGELPGYVRPVAVNSDPRESRMERLDVDGVKSAMGLEARLTTPERLRDLAPRGGEAWFFIVVLLLLAYAAEAFAGWRATLRRERERNAGGIA